MVGEAVTLAIQLAVVGMSVVFIALLLMIGLLSLMQRLDRSMTKSKTEAVPAAEPVVSPGAAPVGDGLSPELMAAISAAVTVAMSRKVRVTRMRYLGTPPEATWSRQGRLTIMASHRPKG